jgi:hypothetical protein
MTFFSKKRSKYLQGSKKITTFALANQKRVR